MAGYIVGAGVMGVGSGIGSIFAANAQANNISDEVVKALIKVSNTAGQNCVIDTSQNQVVNVSGNTGGTIVINEDWQQNLNLNSECLQSVQFQTNVQQAISEESKQIAKAIAQQFQLSSADSNNVAREVAQVSTQVTNSFLQNCVNFEAQNQVFTFSNNVDVNATVYQNWDQYNVSTFNCVMQDEAVTSTTQAIKEDTNQSAEATIQNFLAGILGAIFGIIAIIGLVFFGLLLFGFIGRGGGSTKVTVAAPDSS